MYEDAWNDKQGRPAPGLARALDICGGCPVREPCLIVGLPEKYGVWGGTVPPERGHATNRWAEDVDPIEIIHRTGAITGMKITPQGKITFTTEDFEPERQPVPGMTVEDIDRRFRAEWDKARDEIGPDATYHDIPSEKRWEINEAHRLAHVERVKAEKAQMGPVKKSAPTAPGGKTVCGKGHDLSSFMPNGKPMLTTTGKCRLCLEYYNERRRQKIAAGLAETKAKR